MSKMTNILEMLDIERQEKDKKRAEYQEYIQNHISNVELAYTRYMLPLMSLSDDKELVTAIQDAGVNIHYHDLSKYSKYEFEPYRLKFFPTDNEKSEFGYETKVKRLFSQAWKHHHDNNPHHVEHWNKKDMPLEYIIEMLCDWSAMSMYFGTSTKEWWESDKTQNDEASYMTDYTRNMVDTLLYKLVPDMV